MTSVGESLPAWFLDIGSYSEEVGHWILIFRSGHKASKRSECHYPRETHCIAILSPLPFILWPLKYQGGMVSDRVAEVEVVCGDVSRDPGEIVDMDGGFSSITGEEDTN